MVVKSFHLCGSEDSKGLSDDINPGTLESTSRPGAARSVLHPLQCRGEGGRAAWSRRRVNGAALYDREHRGGIISSRDWEQNTEAA